MRLFPSSLGSPITASSYDVFSLRNVVALVWQRTRLSLATLPSLRGWLETLGLFVVLAVPAYWLSTTGGWYSNPPSTDPVRWLHLFLAALVMPALIEEIIVRAWMVPHPSEDVTTQWRWSAILGAIVLFVALHPLNGWMRGGKTGALFMSADFIFIVTLLAVTCHIAYQRTGSIWAPTLIHALLVTCWGILRG